MIKIRDKNVYEVKKRTTNILECGTTLYRDVKVNSKTKQLSGLMRLHTTELYTCLNMIVARKLHIRKETLFMTESIRGFINFRVIFLTVNVISHYSDHVSSVTCTVQWYKTWMS